MPGAWPLELLNAATDPEAARLDAGTPWPSSRSAGWSESRPGGIPSRPDRGRSARSTGLVHRRARRAAATRLVSALGSPSVTAGSSADAMTAGAAHALSRSVHELLELDDPGELGAVVGRQAHAVDHDVAHGPAIAALDHPILEGRSRPFGRARSSARWRPPFDGSAAVDLRPRGDPGDERPLEEVAIQVRELLALGLAPIPPRGSERELGRLADVEDLTGDGANGAQTLRVLAVRFGIREDERRVGEERSELGGRRRRPGS